MNTKANTDQRVDQMRDMPNLCSSIFEGSSLPTTMLAGAKHVVRYANPAFGRLLLIWLTQQTAMGSVERCLVLLCYEVDTCCQETEVLRNSPC